MEIILHPDVTATLAALKAGKKSDPRKYKKVLRTIEMIATDHRHTSLASHRYELLDRVWGEAIWQSYVEQGTPSAWRMWWYFGPDTGTITIIAVGPHP
jgi:hypothetical protein